MLRPFAYFVEIRDNTDSFTLAAWQSRWIEQTITWNSKSWRYFAGLQVSGIVSGQTIGSQVTIVLSLTRETMDLAKRIANPPGIAIVSKYDLCDATDTSQMLAVGNSIGQITQITRTDTQFTFSLGSSISPVGASFVPRTFTTELIGNGMLQI